MKADRAYLEHIRDALRDIDAYCNVGREVFMSDRMRQDAVGEIWPIVRGMLNPKTNALLFTNGNATSQMRELIKIGATELCLRHDFTPGRLGQDWYNTFWLQIGSEPTI